MGQQVSEEMTTKPKMPKPLPCPVCGKEPKVYHKVFDSRVTAECVELTVLGDHIITARAATEDEAVERWNRMVGK